MANNSAYYMQQVGLFEKEYPLENQFKTGYYTIELYTEQIVVISITGGFDNEMLLKLNKFLSTYSYHRLIRFPKQKTICVIEYFPLQNKGLRTHLTYIGNVHFLISVCLSSKGYNWPNAVVKNFKKRVIHNTNNLDDALLFAYTWLQQKETFSQQDYISNFNELWVKKGNKAIIYDINLRVITNPTWILKFETPYFYTDIQVVEGNIFIVKILGTMNSFAAEGFVLLLKSVCNELNIKIPYQKIILVIDATNINSFSSSVFKYIYEIINRENFILYSILVPSGAIVSFFYYNRFFHSEKLKKWIIETDIKNAVLKAAENQLCGFYYESAYPDNSEHNYLNKKQQFILKGLYSALKPLLTSNALNDNVKIIQTPHNLEDFINNMVVNFIKNNTKYNISTKNEIIQPTPHIPFELLNNIKQEILYCCQNQIIWANNATYNKLGYRIDFLSNQPLSTIVDLTDVSIILNSNIAINNIVNITIYHFEGHNISEKCAIVKTDNNSINYYLIFIDK